MEEIGSVLKCNSTKNVCQAVFGTSKRNCFLSTYSPYTFKNIEYFILKGKPSSHQLYSNYKRN